MSNERPILVAPRPVRLASTFFNRKQETDFTIIAEISPDPQDRLSRPPSSAALPSEALDEFLSILKPSFMRKPRSVTFPTFLQERPLALWQLPRVDSRTEPRDAGATVCEDHLLCLSSTTEHSTDIRLLHPDSDARQWFSSTILGKCLYVDDDHAISRLSTSIPCLTLPHAQPIPEASRRLPSTGVPAKSCIHPTSYTFSRRTA